MAITSVTITSGPTVVGRSVTISGTLNRDGGGTLNALNFLSYTVGYVSLGTLTRLSDNAVTYDASGTAGSGIAWTWTGVLPEGNYLGVSISLNDSPYTTFATSSNVGLIQLRKPLAGVWTPRRDARGLFVPKDPTYPYPSSRVWNKTKTFFYPTSTGVYRGNTDTQCREGQYGGIARGVSTPFGLGIDAPTNWEWKGLTPASYQTNSDSGFVVSLFSLYNASKFISSDSYPAVLGESRASFNITDNLAGWWRNSAGEQSVLVRNNSSSFGGGDLTVNGLGNGLHCLVVCFTIGSGASGTRVFLNGDFVGSCAVPTFQGWMFARPYYFYSGISQSSLNVGNVHFHGESASVNLTNAQAAALSLDPYRYFFRDAPARSLRAVRNMTFDANVYQYSRPISDISNTGWVRVP